MKRLPYWVWTGAALVVAVVVPRLVVLPHSVIDWDESVYALVAQHLLWGHMPYETVFDHKPMGLYLIFAGFFAIFGDSVPSIRIIAIAFVAATAAVLAWLARHQFDADSREAALIAAVYGFLTLASGGMATNTEILINLFVVSAVALIAVGRLDQRVSFPHSLLIGLVLGMLFQVNYLGGLLIAGVAGFYLAWLAGAVPGAVLARLYLVNGLVILFGFALANFVIVLPIVIAGDFPAYLSLQRAYLSGYESDANMIRLIQRIYEGAGPSAPFLSLAVVIMLETLHRRFIRREQPPMTEHRRRVRAWVVLWLFCGLAASASGRFFEHFFLFLLPATVMLAAALLWLLREQDALHRGAMIWMLLLSAFIGTDNIGMYVGGLRGYLNMWAGRPADGVAAASQAMARDLGPDDTIYVYDADVIHYFQARVKPPTRFVFPDHHLKEGEAERLGFGRPAHMADVLARKPKFIVVNGDPSDGTYGEASDILAAALATRYRPTNLTYTRGSRDVTIYERLSDP